MMTFLLTAIITLSLILRHAPIEPAALRELRSIREQKFVLDEAWTSLERVGMPRFDFPSGDTLEGLSDSQIAFASWMDHRRADDNLVERLLVLLQYERVMHRAYGLDREEIIARLDAIAREAADEWESTTREQRSTTALQTGANGLRSRASPLVYAMLTHLIETRHVRPTDEGVPVDLLWNLRDRRRIAMAFHVWLWFHRGLLGYDPVSERFRRIDRRPLASPFEGFRITYAHQQ